MLRFFAKCAAATHCPIFLKPLQAVCASSPVNVLILPAMAELWLRTSVVGEPREMSAWLLPVVACEAPGPGVLLGTCPAGGPPAGGGERCAKAGAAKARAPPAT